MKSSIVYLAGPINGCTDDEANGWRAGFMERNPQHRYLDPMVRDYRGREDESVCEIVEGDMADIEECEVFLAYHWKVSDGTSMEIFFAKSIGKRVIVVIPGGQRISPWVRYHSDALVHTLDEAVQYL